MCLLENSLQEGTLRFTLGTEVNSDSNDGQSELLDHVLALHELEVVATGGLIRQQVRLRGAAHELLTVTVRDSDSAELLKDLL